MSRTEKKPPVVIPFTLVNEAGEITLCGTCNPEQFSTIAPAGHKVFQVLASPETHRFDGSKIVKKRSTIN